MEQDGHNYLEVGADLMAITLFFFLCLAAVSRPENEAERQRALRDVRMPTAGGTELPNGPAIDLFVRSGSVTVRFENSQRVVSRANNLADALKTIVGQKSGVSVNVYADIHTSFQEVVAVLDAVQQQLPKSTINIGVMERS